MKIEQEKVKKIRKLKKWTQDPKIILLSMQEELGEVTASFLSNHDDTYNKNKRASRHKLDEELGDLLHMLIALANVMEIDLDKSLENTHKKIRYKK